MAKILVVDDERGYLDLLELILKTDGHEVETSVTGVDAVEVGRRWHPHLLLADWKLKDSLCGLDVAKILHGENPDLVTIVMTGYSASMLRSQARDIQNLHVIEKPFDTDALRGLIEKVLDSRRN